MVFLKLSKKQVKNLVKNKEGLKKQENYIIKGKLLDSNVAEVTRDNIYNITLEKNNNGLAFIFVDKEDNTYVVDYMQLETKTGYKVTKVSKGNITYDYNLNTRLVDNLFYVDLLFPSQKGEEVIMFVDKSASFVFDLKDKEFRNFDNTGSLITKKNEKMYID